MGGYLAALYAARHPEVTRLVLLAPAFGFARRWPERLGADADGSWRAPAPWKCSITPRTGSRGLSYAPYGRRRTYEDFPDFRQPALIFHGAHDDVVPVPYSLEFAAAHPNARLEVLDSGHELLNVLDYMAPKVSDFFWLNSPRRCAALTSRRFCIPLCRCNRRRRRGRSCP